MKDKGEVLSWKGYVTPDDLGLSAQSIIVQTFPGPTSEHEVTGFVSFHMLVTERYQSNL